MSEQSYNILAVDDEPLLLYSLIAYLEDNGFNASGATSGEEALVMLERGKYDAVIVDIRLPGIDGNEVILSAMKSGHHIPFLIHTGSTDYQLPNSLKKIGFSVEDVFIKPLSDLNILCTALYTKLKQGK